MFKLSIIFATAWGGMLLLGASTIFPWTQVPMASLDHPGIIVMVEPSISTFLKLGCLVIVLFGFLIVHRRYSAGTAMATATSCWLVVLLLYPFAVTVWHPRLSAQAAGLQSQYENLTGFGGDIGMGAEFASAPHKELTYPVDPPCRFAVFNLPQCHPSEFEMWRLSDLCDWLGYSEAFCQFSRLGWYLAILGCFSVLVSCFEERPDWTRIMHVIRVVFFTGGAAATVAWAVTFYAGSYVRDAETSVRKGDYESALSLLDRAEQILPILRHDSYLVIQRGLLYDRLGRSDRLEARLYQATIRERDGRFDEANKLYRELLKEAPPLSPCRREACRAILRDAIHVLNSGSVGAAMDELNEVLQADPTNLKAMSVLQLACVRSGQHDQVVDLGYRQSSICESFQHPLKDAIRSNSHHNNSVSALEKGDLTTAIEDHQKASNP